MNNETKERIESFLEGKGLRRTSQRKAILDAVLSTREHFTAEALLKMAQEKDPSVSRATVYRTLTLLTEGGLLKELDLGKEFKYYDPNYLRNPNHHHLICNDCGKIVEFESKDIELLESEITLRLGFTIRSHRIEIRGDCENLRKTSFCPHRASGEKKPVL